MSARANDLKEKFRFKIHINKLESRNKIFGMAFYRFDLNELTISLHFCVSHSSHANLLCLFASILFFKHGIS